MRGFGRGMVRGWIRIWRMLLLISSLPHNQPDLEGGNTDDPVPEFSGITSSSITNLRIATRTHGPDSQSSHIHSPVLVSSPSSHTLRILQRPADRLHFRSGAIIRSGIPIGPVQLQALVQLWGGFSFRSTSFAVCTLYSPCNHPSIELATLAMNGISFIYPTFTTKV